MRSGKNARGAINRNLMMLLFAAAGVVLGFYGFRQIASGLAEANAAVEDRKIQDELAILEDENLGAGGPTPNMLETRLRGWDIGYSVRKEGDDSLIITTPSGDQVRATATSRRQYDGTTAYDWTAVTID